jgi:hypothetical protein
MLTHSKGFNLNCLKANASERFSVVFRNEMQDDRTESADSGVESRPETFP